MFRNIVIVTSDLGDVRKAARMAGDTARQMQPSSLRLVVAYAPVPDFLGTAPKAPTEWPHA